MRLSLRRLSLMLVAIFTGFGLYAQGVITGTVTEPSGEALIGVSVVVQGTTTGTITDLDGKFSLTVPANADALVFSYTGFGSQTVPIDGSMTIVDVVLEEDVARLDEVVVTGLASGVKRSNSGNAVATITSDELVGQTQIQTVDGALNGKLAGVNINANGGAPGGGINVQLRGISTLGAGSSQPLYIVDGVYVNNSSIRNGRSQISGATGGSSSATQDNAANRIADLNPEDIERIEVLKGPSAAAIYGTRANAGVIIITTKRGKAGETRVSFSQDIGIAQGQNFQGFDDFGEDNLTARGVGQSEFDALEEARRNGTIVDWEEEMYGETPLLSNSQLSISGGSQNTQFYVSGGITSEDGIIKNTGFDRYSIRANVDQKIGGKIRLALNTNYVRTDNDRGFTGNQNNTGGSLGYAIAYTPTYASLQPDAAGNYPNNPYFNDNPYAIRDLGVNNQLVDRFITAAVLDIDIFSTANSFLKFKANGGVDYLSAASMVYFPEILQHQQANALPGDVTHGRQDNINTNLQGFLNYNTQLGTVNSNTSLGIIRLDQRSEFLLQRGQGLTAGQTNLAFAQVSSTLSQFDAEQADIGYVIQQDMNWDDKIIGSVGIRFDKSTLNLQENELYAFAKASLAVNLHNFDFLSTSGPISQLKLRGAWGQTGGLPNPGVIFESLNGVNVDGQLGVTAPTNGVDPSLVPETANELELGLDFGLFENRVVFEGTYYNKQVNDLILSRRLAESTGVTTVVTNAADLKNEGFELGLTLNPVRSANFDWTSRILYWQNRSEITRLDIPAFTQGGFGPALGTYLLAEGFSPTTIIGLPNLEDSPETLGFTVFGDRQPDFTMTWFNTFTIAKNLEAGFLMHYQNGGNNINLSALLWDDGGSTPNWAGDDDGDGEPNGLQRLLDWAGRPGVPRNTGVYIQPTSYIKLREASLYYTLPPGVFGGDFVKRLKVGVSANNLLLWTNYGSYDPEVSNFGTQAITSAIEVTPYPSARRLFFHVKADF